MKLVMTLLVRNEADILEANLDYHLAQGVDFVIVTDHRSSDGTVELLQRYERAGVAMVRHEDGAQHDQSARVTRMARLAFSLHGADWVINNDADEFWWPLSGSLRDVFAAIPSGYGQIEVQRRNFLPRTDGIGPFHSRLVHRDAQSLNPSGLPLEPKIAHRAHPDIVVAAGNHSISGTELQPAPAGELIEILHFPMRSYAQFERKVQQTGVGYEKLQDRPPEVGRDQLKLLSIHRRGGLRGYYDQAVLDDEALDDRVKQGSVVLDRRLDVFMRELPAPAPAPDRPDGPATRSFITRALGAFLELDREREARTREQTHTAAVAEQLATSRAELAATDATLQSLLNSRLLRWSSPLRQVWYRNKRLLGRHSFRP